MGNMLWGAKPPCIGCKDRFFDGERTCHCTCDGYLAYREERHRMYKEALREAEIESVLDDFREYTFHRRVGKKQPLR